MTDSTHDVFDTLAKILLRCLIFGFLLLLLWFGIGVHWTAQTVPRSGAPKPFQRAVADFDLKRFIAAVEHAGADYVLFTAAHALQILPAPHPLLDKILSSTTIMDGWGIHWSPWGGWVWSLSAGQCVVIRRPRGVIRVGTDDAERLAELLKTRTRSQVSPGTPC